jgi:hypothetical protein
VDRIRTLGSSLRLFILVDDRFGRSSHRLFDDSGGDFDDVPSNVVVLFWTIVYGRHSRGAVTVVRLLGDEPIRITFFFLHGTFWKLVYAAQHIDFIVEDCVNQYCITSLELKMSR